MIDSFGETGMRVDSWIEAIGVLRCSGATRGGRPPRSRRPPRPPSSTVAERRAAELKNPSGRDA